MQLPRKTKSGIILLGCVLAGWVTAAAGSELDVGQSRQLFIDDYIIESLDGVTKTLNQPVKYGANPVLPMVPEGDPSWEAGMHFCFTTILFDEADGLYKMWYSLWGEKDQSMILAYAHSRDGIRWVKPSLGIVEHRGSRDNNIIMDQDGLETGVFIDPRETDPARRFKMLYQGIRAAYSADGLHWTDYNGGEKVIFHAPGHDSQPVPYWDGRLGKYVAIIRDRTGMIKEVRKKMVTDPWARRVYAQLWGGLKKDRVPENHSLRRVGQVESDDFVHWTPMRTVVAADDRDPMPRDQFYNMQVLLHDELRIGLMTVFSYGYERPRGPVQLTYSRDGLNWHRGGGREVFLPTSERPGDFDWGFIWPVQGPLVRDDEIWIYYVGWGADHNSVPPDGFTGFKSGVALSKLRLDGFVSVDAGAGGGVLTTKPFRFRGGELLINADAESGRVQVEILSADGSALENFGKDNCDALESDAVRHRVTWNGQGNLKDLEGQPLRLKFHLRNAKLFSFGFRDR